MVKKTDFNAKISKVEGKIPSISGLATSSALTAVENKILDVSSLVKKSDYSTEITKIKNYVINAAWNSKHNELVKKTDFDDKVKKITDKINSNSSDVLSYGSKVKQIKDRIDDLERD